MVAFQMSLPIIFDQSWRVNLWLHDMHVRQRIYGVAVFDLNLALNGMNLKPKLSLRTVTCRWIYVLAVLFYGLKHLIGVRELLKSEI
jgi:hypothetical protein